MSFAGLPRREIRKIDDLDQGYENDNLQGLLDTRQTYANHCLLAHLNINSLQNKFDELQLIMNKLKAEILVLTETKIDSSYPNSQFTLTNYKIYRKDRSKGGGGVLIYVSSKFPSKRLNLQKSYKTIEILAVEVRMGNALIAVLGIYRPPRNTGENYFKTLEDELNQLLSWAASKCQTIVITGDLNLDRLRPNEREGRLLIDLEEIFNLKCLINEATRVTVKTQTLLDVIVTNTPDLFGVASVTDLGLSDHKLVYSFLKKSPAKQYEAKVIKCRSTKHLNREELSRDLNDTNWNEIFSHDTNERYANWKSKFMEVIDRHMPVKKMRVRKKDVPYMNAEWKEAIRKRRKYAKKFSKDRKCETWELMKRWRNEATRLRRKAIKSYWNEISLELNENPRKFFSTFMPFISSKGQKETNKIHLNIEGRIEQDQRIVAEEFADYFSTVADAIGGEEATNLTEEKCINHRSIEMIRARYEPDIFVLIY